MSAAVHWPAAAPSQPRPAHSVAFTWQDLSNYLDFFIFCTLFVAS